MSLIKQLVSDAYGVALTRNGQPAKDASSPTAKEAAVAAFVQDGYAVLAASRLRDVARRWHIPGANRALRLFQTVFYGVEIGNQVTLGEGVNFAHTLGIVIGGDAKIGARVKFLGNNTVGTARDNGYPIIEDDVVIGCGARILGPIRIGKGAIVGANAVVVTDVPAGAVVGGIPAKILKMNGTEGDVVPDVEGNGETSDAFDKRRAPRNGVANGVNGRRRR